MNDEKTTKDEKESAGSCPSAMNCYVLESLPKTVDGMPIVPDMMVYCIVGEHVDERKVIGPYGKYALLTHEPAMSGTCAGSAHRLANTVFSTRKAAEEATKT